MGWKKRLVKERDEVKERLDQLSGVTRKARPLLHREGVTSAGAI